jgi:Phospholipase_D-nuclease N-terminal
MTQSLPPRCMVRAFPSTVRSPQEVPAQMAVLADYPFLNIMLSMLVFFAWVIFIYLLILVLADNFRRTDHSGLAKAGWTLFVIFVPLIGILVYMIVRPSVDMKVA